MEGRDDAPFGMKRARKATCTALVLLLAGLPEPGLSAAADEADTGAAATTNGLIFKKRPRRQYTSSANISPSGTTVPIPVEPKEASTLPDAGILGEGTKNASLIGKGAMQGIRPGMPPGPRKPSRGGRDKKDDDADWLLTPQQRIQKEIDVLSGKEEEDEEEDSYGWLADEVESIREEKIKAREQRNRREEEEAEAEEIAAIMGRNLFGGPADGRSTGLLRDDRGRLQLPAGSDQRPGFGADITNAVAAPALRVRPDDERVEPGMTAGSREPAPPSGEEKPRAAGPASEIQNLNERYSKAPADRSAAERMSSGAAPPDRGGASARRSDETKEAATPSTGIPSPFEWNSSSGGGYAGLPASVAPSITPAAGGGVRGTGWPGSPGVAGTPGASLSGPGVLSGSRFSPRQDVMSPAPVLIPRGGTPPGSPAPLRTPFMSPMTPGLQSGAGYGTLPARSP